MKKLTKTFTSGLSKLVRTLHVNIIFKSLLISFRYAVVTFIVLLFFLKITNEIQGLIDGSAADVFDLIDFAVALMGFVLMFAGKFLETVYGKVR